MTKHSSIVGGSNAVRLLNCPGSHQALLSLPPVVDVPSPYADEGTAMHAVMDILMRFRMDAGLLGDDSALNPDNLIGQFVHDRVLTREHVDGMILPALDHLSELEKYYGGHFEVRGIEQRVRFPGMPGAFGTVDLILDNGETVILVDWKFGQGVGVRTVYSDGEGAVVNAQLMFYTAAALKTKPRWFTRRRIAVAIIQPRNGADPLTHTVVTRHEIKQFIEDVHNAVLLAIGREPPRKKGEHCRFAPCKVTCPLWTGPLLDLSVLDPMPRPVGPPVAAAVTPYGNYLARAKMLVDTVAMMQKTIDEQLHAYLENGGTVPGWRLKLKAKQRQWADLETVADALEALGFEEHEIWQDKLQTFQSVDATAKRRGVKIPDELRVAPPSTETTLATSDDPAPVVEPHKLIEKFSEALRQLKAR